MKYLAVVGSRGYIDSDFIFLVLDALFTEYMYEGIVSGGCKNSPDEIAAIYANLNNIPLLEIKPDWKQYGKSAGFKRNVEIWDNAHSGVAFWDGVSKGTKHSFYIAKSQNKDIIIFKGQELYE